MSFDELDISLGENIQHAPKGRSMSRSKPISSAKISLKKRIELEDQFFKINYYFGGALEIEIEKIIPQLIEKFKDKDEDQDMDMSFDMGDMVGMVNSKS